MNIDIHWDYQNSETLICEFHGDWTWHECREAMQVMNYMQDGSGFAADYVFDLSRSTLAPRACLNRLRKLLNMPMEPAPRHIVIVDQFHRSRLMEAMLNTVAQALGIQFVDSLTQARYALQEPEML
jgi:hypothetical protein